MRPAKPRPSSLSSSSSSTSSSSSSSSESSSESENALHFLADPPLLLAELLLIASILAWSCSRDDPTFETDFEDFVSDFGLPHLLPSFLPSSLSSGSKKKASSAFLASPVRFFASSRCLVAASRGLKRAAAAFFGAPSSFSSGSAESAAR